MAPAIDARRLRVRSLRAADMTEQTDQTTNRHSSPSRARVRGGAADADATAVDNWQGFEPTGYTIDWTLVYDMAVTEIDEDGRQIETSVGAVLREALPHLFPPLNEESSIGARVAVQQVCNVNESIGRVTITTPNRQIKLNTLGRGSFAAQVAALCVEIERQCGSDRFYPIFFYYDEDYMVSDFHEAFSFFVVNNDRIVLDGVTITRTDDNGFDPKIFAPAFRSGRQPWHSASALDRARVRWWYRRFYEETDAGRLTLLRDDVDIYGYTPESRQLEQIASRVEILARDTARLGRFVAGVLALLVLIAILLWR
jgi:hypothetical protein